MSTKYPNKNPNLTDEQVDEWMLRVQGQHPDQIEEDRREKERMALLLKNFPHDVIVDLVMVSGAFGGPGPDDDAQQWFRERRGDDWIRNWKAWMVEQFGPECTNWQTYMYPQYRDSGAVNGGWVSIGTHVYFSDKTQATLMKTMYGGSKEEWD